jgi:uncharacterized repeat protein (TIGR02543 family)
VHKNDPTSSYIGEGWWSRPVRAKLCNRVPRGQVPDKTAPLSRFPDLHDCEASATAPDFYGPPANSTTPPVTSCDPPCEGGTCEANNTCACEEGWTGNRCQTAICDDPACGQNEVCSAPDTCDCAPGWSGENCDVAYSCANPCQNGGTCTGPNTCTCTGGYTGAQCQTPPAGGGAVCSAQSCGSCNSQAHCALAGCNWTGAVCQQSPEGGGVTVPPLGFVWIEPGTFLMGPAAGEPTAYLDGNNKVSVTLTRHFLISETEVTQAQWVEVSGGQNPSCYQSSVDGCSNTNSNGDNPVERVSWWSALEYLNALSQSQGLTPCYVLPATGCTGTWQAGSLNCGDSVMPTVAGGNVYACDGYRLPTEAEWEYAARAGTQTATYGGDFINPGPDWPSCLSLGGGDFFESGIPLSTLGWYSCGSAQASRAVRQKAPNAWGLYDMLGNLEEWTWDRADASGRSPVPGGTDPQRTTSGTHRIARGGSRGHGGTSLRAAYRGSALAYKALAYIGFRPVRTVPPPSSIRVTYKPAGGTCTPNIKDVVWRGEYGQAPCIPTRTGYTFAGWWTGLGGTATHVTSMTLVNDNAGHTLYANWTPNEYLVTYDATGGVCAPNTKNVSFGTAYGAAPCTPSRTGYTFAGWWTGAGGGGTEVTPESRVMLSAAHTLQAKWTIPAPAMKTTSTTARISVPSTGFDVGTGDYTLEAWIKPHTDFAGCTSYSSALFQMNENYGINSFTCRYGLSDRLIYCSAYGGGPGDPYVYSTPLTVGTWHHFAYVRSNGTHAMYLNGVRTDIGPNTTALWSTSPTSFGKPSGYGDQCAPPVVFGATRFSRIARYSQSFTPARSWPVDAHTRGQWLTSQTFDGTTLVDEAGGDNSSTAVSGFVPATFE